MDLIGELYWLGKILIAFGMISPERRKIVLERVRVLVELKEERV